MARLPRIVIPNTPHHVTQRGNRRQLTFLVDSDYGAYKALLAEAALKYGVEIWAYCLMPNHVHIVAVPPTEGALAATFSRAHEAYTRSVNFREGWRGHLWQGRFFSAPLDESYLLACVRYIELNPVRAGLCESAWSYRWSSAAAHLSCQGDGLVAVQPLLKREPDWRTFVDAGDAEVDIDKIRLHTRTGRPICSMATLEAWESLSGKVLKKMPSGRTANPGDPGGDPGTPDLNELEFV